jgi:hypothetical protein
MAPRRIPEWIRLMTAYRLFPAASGPSSPVSYSGPFMAGVLFQVTSGGIWFDGYWWWVCPSGQSTAPQKFALWQVHNVASGALISTATATSGPLTAGQWNYVPLDKPVPLSIGACYNACTGLAGDFPDTPHSFGSGQPYGAGITAGPLSAFSDQSGSLPAPFAMSQATFSVAGSDPAAIMPANGASSDNLWIDLQVSDKAPDGASYRLWPNYPVASDGGIGLSNDMNQETMGTEFTLSSGCTLNRIWFYSPPGVSVLPDGCMIWDIATQQMVPGTKNLSPPWSAGPGSGWVSCAYNGVTLPAGDYVTSVYYGGGQRFYVEQNNYFGGSGPASAAGIVTGPLTSPNLANAAPPGNSRYRLGGLLFPDTTDDEDHGETRWVDVEVTPGASAPPPPPVNSGAFLAFFP